MSKLEVRGSASLVLYLPFNLTLIVVPIWLHLILQLPFWEFLLCKSRTTVVHQKQVIPYRSPLSILTLLSADSVRSWTPIKMLGDGSFGNVWLCDWHSPPDTPLPVITRPEWAKKHLVAVKRLKQRWEAGWDECRKLKEIEVNNTDLPSLC